MVTVSLRTFLHPQYDALVGVGAAVVASVLGVPEDPVLRFLQRLGQPQQRHVMRTLVQVEKAAH